MTASATLPLLLLLSTSTGPVVPHVFTTPGPKSVTLQVCSSPGQCSSVTKNLVVLDPRPTIASMSVPALVGSAEPFVSLSAVLGGRPPLVSAWTVAGPQGTATLTGSSAAWVPDSLGLRQVRLRLTNPAGLITAGPLPLSVVPSSFADVSPTHWGWASIELLAANGITSGCASLAFCPEGEVTRAQMAVFLTRAVHGQGFVPPPATGTRFDDVPANYWAAAFIEQLAADGITSGCGLDIFCPELPLPRAQAAVLLLRALRGPLYTPPPASGTLFTDVPPTYWAAAWIEDLARQGITSGCGAALFCPELSVNRAQMAVFLAHTFNLTHRPAPALFQAVLCPPSSCTYPAGLPLQFLIQVTRGLPETYEYDWNGDGTWDETATAPVHFHAYALAGTYRPRVRLRHGTWTSPVLAHAPITVRSVSISGAPPVPTGLSAAYIGVQAPTHADPPGTLWREAYALWAMSQGHRGFVVYLSISGGPSRPAAFLPATPSGVNLLSPYLRSGLAAAVYFEAFNDSGISLSSSVIALPHP
jgi:hypothetical protein